MAAAAAAIAVAASVALTSALGTPLDLAHTLLAVPAAFALVAVAGFIPAIIASHAAPLDAVRDHPTLRLRRIRLRGVASLAAAGLLRSPARIAGASASVAMGVASTVAVLSVLTAFRGDVVGTLLGDVVALQARPYDLAASVFIAVLGLVAIGDLIYLDVTAHASQYAALEACGWTKGMIRRTLAWQAGIVASAGAVAGAGGGVAAMAALTQINGFVVTIAAAVSVVVVVAACAVSLVPAWLARRMSLADVLAEE